MVHRIEGWQSHSSRTAMTEDRSESERLTSMHIARAAQHDRASTAWLVSRFTPLLLCQARYRIPPTLQRYCDADDVVADVWMAVLPALPALVPSRGSFARGLLSFASTVLIRRVRDLLEKHIVGKPPTQPLTAPGEEVDELAAGTRGVVSHVIAEERRGTMWAVLDHLSPEDREIMVLRGIEGLSHREVAARVGLTAGNIAVRYHRLLARLRALVPASVVDELEG